MYLTDAVAAMEPRLNLHRQVPVLLEPEDLDVDVFACTHNHPDHTDTETIRRLRHKDAGMFVGPHPSCEVFAQEGVETGRIVPVWPTHAIEHRDLKLTSTFSLPTDTSDLNHLGFVIQFGNGPKIYMTGDTDYHELLFSAASYNPDLMITCINGGFNNMSHCEAADLAARVKPKAAIPCHYDMFADNSVDPKQFRASLILRAPGVAYQELKHGSRFEFSTEL